MIFHGRPLGHRPPEFLRRDLHPEISHRARYEAMESFFRSTRAFRIEQDGREADEGIETRFWPDRRSQAIAGALVGILAALAAVLVIGGIS